jgi:hypothetical protein
VQLLPPPCFNSARSSNIAWCRFSKKLSERLILSQAPSCHFIATLPLTYRPTVFDSSRNVSREGNRADELRAHLHEIKAGADISNMVLAGLRSAPYILFKNLAAWWAESNLVIWQISYVSLGYWSTLTIHDLLFHAMVLTTHTRTPCDHQSL